MDTVIVSKKRPAFFSLTINQLSDRFFSEAMILSLISIEVENDVSVKDGWKFCYQSSGNIYSILIHDVKNCLGLIFIFSTFLFREQISKVNIKGLLVMR